MVRRPDHTTGATKAVAHRSLDGNRACRRWMLIVTRSAQYQPAPTTATAHNVPNHAIRSTDWPSPNPSSASDRKMTATTTAASAHTITSEREAIRTRLATRIETTSGSTYSTQSPLTRRPATAATSDAAPQPRRSGSCSGRPCWSTRSGAAGRRGRSASLKQHHHQPRSGSDACERGASGPARLGEAAGTSAQRFETAVHDSRAPPSGATSEAVGDERPVGIRKVMIPASRTRPSSVSVPTRTPPICRRCSSVST